MKNRVIFGIIGAIMVIGLVMISPYTLYAAVLALTCTAIWEMYWLVGKRNFIAFLIISLVLITCFSSLIGLRHIDETITFVIFACLGAFVTDTAALFFGLKWGHHKLSKISPKKTWEGAIGGTLTSVLVISIYMLIIGRFAAWVPWVALATSVAAILGDLTASLIKRTFGAKDYGAIIPGHGGIMDRCDSLMFAAPVSYLLLTIII